MPYGEPYDPLDGLGALGAIRNVKQLNTMYSGVKRKKRLGWLEKRLVDFQKRLSIVTEKHSAAKTEKARKKWSRQIKITNNLIARANTLKRVELALRGEAPPPPTPQQVDQAVEVEQAATQLEEIAEVKEETPVILVKERESKARMRRIPTPLTDVMTNIEAEENFPLRLRLIPLTVDGVGHTEVKVEPIKDLPPDAVKGYTLRRRDGELIIEPIAETLTPTAGVGVLPAAVAAVASQAPEIAQSVAQAGKEELSNIVKQGGLDFNIKEFLQNNIKDIKSELSDKVYDLTGGAFGKKKKKIKWYQKHGWKNSPPKDCPKYKDKVGGKHCMHRAAYRLWKKLGKPSLAYGIHKRAGMRALEVLVGVRKKKAWLFAKSEEPYDAINWAAQNVPGFDPHAAGVPTSAVSAREIEMANQAAGENAVIRPKVPLLETTAGKVAAGGGIYLLGRALGWF